MPNRQDVKKRYMSFLMTRILFYQVTKAAQDKGVSRSNLATETLERAFGHIELDKETHEKIKREIARARKRREYL